VGCLDVKIRIICVAIAALVLAGCAEQSAGVDDPLEPFNRRIFAFNHSLDNHAALPAASYYKSAVPDGVRDGLHNFLSNLAEPVSFANDVLQGQMTRAGVSVCRFGINTTAGVVGVMDKASDWGCPAYHPQDFGLTLGDYGVPGGPYLVLPLIGSSMPRDAAGKIFVDHFFSPLGYVTYHGKLYVSLGRTFLDTVDQRSRAIDKLRDIERSSIDYYAAMRSIYIQRREADIQDDALDPAPQKQ
jgi:phospholipid-binding lipoprotein MlaA